MYNSVHLMKSERGSMTLHVRGDVCLPSGDIYNNHGRKNALKEFDLLYAWVAARETEPQIDEEVAEIISTAGH